MGLRIKAELGGDGTGFERMMNRAGATTNHFASHTIGHLKNMIAGAFSIGAIESLTRGTLEYAHHIRDLSDELGVNVEWLQEMQFALKQSGANADDLEKVMRRIATSRAAALGAGGGKQLAAFHKFGVGVGEIQTGRITDIVDKIAKAFETGNQQELLPAFQALGGKGAGVLVPAFVNGILKAREEAQKAGAVIGEDVIDQLADIEEGFQRLKMELTAGFAPILIKVMEAFRGFGYILKEFFAGVVGFFTGMDWKKVFGALLNPWADQSGLKEEFNKGMERAKQTRKEQADDDEKSEGDLMHAQKARRDARHKREIQKIDISPLEAPAERFQFARNSDALTSVGNFLGGTGAAADLVSVGEKTNRLLQDANTHLGNIATNTTRSGGGSGVPEE